MAVKESRVARESLVSARYSTWQAPRVGDDGWTALVTCPAGPAWATAAAAAAGTRSPGACSTCRCGSARAARLRARAGGDSLALRLLRLVHGVGQLLVGLVEDPEGLVGDEQERAVIGGCCPVFHPPALGEPDEVARPELALVGGKDAVQDIDAVGVRMA